MIDVIRNGEGHPLDFLQATWLNPSREAVVYMNEEAGVMVVPGGKPFVPGELGHVLVAGREAKPFYELDEREQTLLGVAAGIVMRRVVEEFKPARGASLQIFGVEVPTTHIHVFPRNIQSDGQAAYDNKRPFATAEQMTQTQQRLLHPSTDGVRRTLDPIDVELDERLAATMRRYPR